MGSNHAHDHGRRSEKSLFGLKLALGLTFGYMIIEAIGGWIANSLALIADAGHMFTDVGALALTLGAIWFASRPATSKKNLRLLPDRDTCRVHQWRRVGAFIDLDSV